MSKTVTIKPKKDSKKFFSNATQFQTVAGPDGQPTDQVRNAGAYRGERFPRSKQFFRPFFSQTKGRWLVGNLSDEDLQSIVKELRWQYERGPDKGKYIEYADVRNSADPFFSHSKLMVMAKEGQYRLDPEKPLDRLMLEALKDQHEFASAAEANGPLSSRVKFVISDSDTDKEIKKTRRKQKQKAFGYFDKLTHKKKLAIATAMALNVRDDIDPDILDDTLFEMVEDNVTKFEGDETYQSFFIRLCEASSEDLHLKHLIGKARQSGLLRKNRTEGWLLFGNPIGGRHMIDVENYFKDPLNSEMIDRVTEALKHKK